LAILLSYFVYVAQPDAELRIDCAIQVGSSTRNLVSEVSACSNYSKTLRLAT